MAFNTNYELVKLKNIAGLPTDTTAGPSKAVTSTANSNTTEPFLLASNTKSYKDEKLTVILSRGAVKA